MRSEETQSTLNSGLLIWIFYLGRNWNCMEIHYESWLDLESTCTRIKLSISIDYRRGQGQAGEGLREPRSAIRVERSDAKNRRQGRFGDFCRSPDGTGARGLTVTVRANAGGKVQGWLRAGLQRSSFVDVVGTKGSNCRWGRWLDLGKLATSLILLVAKQKNNPM